MLLMVEGTQTTSLQLTYYRCIGGYVNADAHTVTVGSQSSGAPAILPPVADAERHSASPGVQREGRTGLASTERVLPHRLSPSG